MSSCQIITKCRLCQSEKLKDLFSFGLIAPANNYIKPEDIKKKEEKFPLSLCRCLDCGHVQLKETVDKESLFSNYLYASSTSGSLSRYFEKYTEELIKTLKLGPEKGYILDLGSNDGVTLQHFKNRGYKVLGVEPAQNLSKIANDKGIETINTFFDEKVAQEILNKYGYPQCITSSNTYAHLAEHDSFTNGVKILINDINTFVFENASLYATIKGLYFDQIYHDHLSYYWSVPIIDYLNKKNLQVFEIQKTPIQGGSIRVYVRKDMKQNTNPSVLEIISEEVGFGLHQDGIYQDFWKKLQIIKEKFNNVLQEAKKDKKSIACYGAPAKFALFCKFFGLSRKNVKYVVDDSEFKQNMLAPESKIKIVSRETFLNNPPDICVLSAWNFADFIKSKNEQFKGLWLNPFEL